MHHPSESSAPLDARQDSGAAPADPGTTGTQVVSRHRLLRSALGIGIATAAVAAAPASARAAQARVPATSREWHLARRFCTAPTAAIVADIRRLGVKPWFEQQLRPAEIDDSRLEAYASGPLFLSQLCPPDVAWRTNGETWKAAGHALKMLMLQPVFGNRHVLNSTCEVLGDHLYVPIHGKANSFSAEHEQIIRRHAFGKYADLLLAVFSVPALHIHLDNANSSHESPNENLGRELLELFTVGVGNYTETDMKQSTLLLTGHSYSWEERRYRYESWRHYVGPLKIMGFQHPNPNRNSGVEALRAYIGYLARHPATARRLATKFAIRFVSDTPSEALINTMAQAYLDADTGIAPMLRALVDSNEFWASTGQKWRRPFELTNTMLRASKPRDIEPRARDLARYWDVGEQGWMLERAGHLPRSWPHVDGYPDTADAWNNSQTTLAMWNIAVHICVGDIEEFGAADWPKALGVKAGDPLLATVRRLTMQLTGWEWSAEDVAAAAVPLRPWRTVSASDVFDGESLGNLRFAVRLIFCSPYAFLR